MYFKSLLKQKSVILLLCFSLIGSLRVTAQIDTAVLSLPQLSACLGDTIFVPITTTDFNDVSGFQFYLGWSSTDLNYIAVCEFSADENFLSATQQGTDRLQLTWVDLSSSSTINLPDGDTLLLVKYLVASNLGNGSPIFFAEGPSPTVPSREITLTGLTTYRPNVVDGLVTQDQSIALMVTAENIDCRDSLAQLTVGSQLASTTYAWTGPNGFNAMMSSPLVDTSGIYTVIGQNGNCFDTSQVVVNYDTISPTDLVLTTDTITCAEPLALLSGGVSEMNVTYSWTDAMEQVIAVDTNRVEVASAGMYQLLATRTDNGCSVVGIIEVSLDTARAEISLLNSVLELDCQIDTITLLATSTALNATWQWETVGGMLLSADSSLQVTAPATYRVVLENTDNGCRDSSEVMITQNTLPPVIGIAGDTVLTCENTSQWISATGDEGATYRWLAADFSLLATTDSVALMNTGTYFLEGTDLVRACADTVTFSLSIDTLSPSLQLLTSELSFSCIVDSLAVAVQANPMNVSVAWQDGDGLTIADDTATVVLTHTGSYETTATNLNNGCTNNLTFVLTTDTIAPSFTFNLPDTLDCLQSSVQLNIITDDPNDNCEWLNIATDCSVIVSNAGWYEAQVVDAENGCVTVDSLQVIAAPDTISLQLNPSAPYEITCLQDSILLSATSNTPSLNFQWTDANGMVLGTAAAQWINRSGTFQVVATEATTGCAATETLSVVENTLPPVFMLSGEDSLTCERASLIKRVESTEVQNYSWQNILEPASTLSVVDSLSLSQAGNYTVVATNPINGCVDTLLFTIIQDTLSPQLTLFPAQAVLDCRQDSVVFDFVTNVMDYQVDWQNDSAQNVGSNDSLAVFAAGEYSLLLTNPSNGCTAEQFFFVAIDTLHPDLQLLASDSLDCEQTEVILSLASTAADVMCEWQTMAISCDITVGTAGSYWGQVTNPVNGCSTRDTIVVVDLSEDLVPEVALTDTLNCINVEVELSVVTPSPNYTYSWLSEGGMILGGTSELLVDTPAIYRLVSFDPLSNCQDTVLVEVLENTTQPEGGANLSNATLDCNTNSAMLLAENLGPNTVATWFVVVGSPLGTTTVTAAGTYYLELLDTLSNCMILDSVSLVIEDTPPSLALSFPEGTELTCSVSNLPLQVMANNVTYSWQNPMDGSLLSTDSIFNFSTTEPVLLRIVDELTGCSRDTLITVTENTNLPFAMITALVEFDCTTEEGVLAAANPGIGNYNYFWERLDAGAAPATPMANMTTIFEPTSYTLLVTDTENGCQAADTLAVESNFGIPGMIEALVFAPICGDTFGAISVLDVSGGMPPYLYALDVGSFTGEANFSNLLPGTYQLRVQDARGCELDSTFIIDPSITLDVQIIETTNGPYSLGDLLSLDALLAPVFSSTDSLVWYRNNEPFCTNCLSITDTLFESTDYSVEVWSADGCTNRAELFIPVNEQADVYVPNVFSPNNDGNNDSFQIFSGSEVRNITNLTIWDRWGGKVFSRSELDLFSPETGFSGQKNGEPLAPGVYIYQFTMELVNGRKEEKYGDVLILR